jgi:phage terminase small subunit
VRKLSDKQKAFAENYCGKHIGNAMQAAIAAGYSPATALGHSHKLLKNKDVQEYIEYLNANVVTPIAPTAATIATIADIKQFWSNVMNDEDEAIKNRLKASELLAKSSGMFNNDW